MNRRQPLARPSRPEVLGTLCLVLDLFSKWSKFCATYGWFTYRVEPVSNAVQIVNDASQPAPKAHNLCSREYVRELDRSDQSIGTVTNDRPEKAERARFNRYHTLPTLSSRSSGTSGVPQFIEKSRKSQGFYSNFFHDSRHRAPCPNDERGE